MTGLKIIFNGKQSEILPDQLVEGFDATVQNSLVCIGTIVGTDKMFLDKGTNLLTRALRGKLVNSQIARHEANYAAIDTLFFVNETDIEDQPERVTEIILQPVEMTRDSLKVEAQFTSSQGRVVGVLTQL